MESYTGILYLSSSKHNANPNTATRAVFVLLTYKQNKMIKQINLDDFREAFENSDERRNTFSYGALESIFNHLEETEDETNPTELDVVCICCDYTEYDSALDAYKEHYGDDSDLPEEQRRTTEEETREWLDDNTTVLDVENFDMSNPTMALNTPMLTSIVIADF